MTGAPITTSVGLDLYAALEPLTGDDESVGWALAVYLDANGLMLEDVATLVREDAEGHEGWTAFADPARCPDSFLYTLAVWAGVTYPRRMSKDDLRALIGPHAPGVWRGTKGAILAGIQRYLEPGAQIYFEEQADGDPYLLRIFTYTWSTLDEAAIERELLHDIPAGLVVDYQLRSGQSYADALEATGTYADMKATYATYADMRNAHPDV